MVVDAFIPLQQSQSPFGFKFTRNPDWMSPQHLRHNTRLNRLSALSSLGTSSLTSILSALSKEGLNRLSALSSLGTFKNRWKPYAITTTSQSPFGFKFTRNLFEVVAVKGPDKSAVSIAFRL